MPPVTRAGEKNSAVRFSRARKPKVTRDHGEYGHVFVPCFISSPTLYSVVGPWNGEDALSRRRRFRHLLLALFFPATRHLHNYNLASAVSKTPDEGPGYQAPSASVSGPVVVKEKKKKKQKKRRSLGWRRSCRKERIASVNQTGHGRVLLRQKQSWRQLQATDGLVKPFLQESLDTIFAYNLRTTVQLRSSFY